MPEKMRVHILAKELNVPSKTIVEKCKAEGIDSVKNHMSTLSAGLHATIREWFSEGRHDTAVETAERVNLEKVRLKPRRKKKKFERDEKKEREKQRAVAAAMTEVVPEPPLVAPETQAVVEAAAAVQVGGDVEATAEAAPPAEKMDTAVVEPIPPAEVEEAVEPEAEETVYEPTVEPRAIAAEAPPAVSAAVEEPPQAPQLEGEREAEPQPEPEPEPEPEPITPAGPQNVPAAAKLQGPRVVRYEAPEYGQPVTRRRPPAADRATRGLGPGPRPVVPEQLGKEKPGARRKARGGSRRATGRMLEAGERMSEWRDRDLEERRERLAGATGRRIHRRRAMAGAGGATHPVTVGPKTSATVHEPVRMKEFCAETGLNFMQLYRVLKDEHGIVGNVNMTLPTDTAQLLAMHFGIDLEVIPLRTALDELEEEFANREGRQAQPRPPVVTMLGHVDHGKTSLLDAIRKTRAVAGEDGGITQHISSYYVKTSRGAVTFLDTPGHEAFTAMRARGAEVTDVVVLVVAADDGVMPQTVEAIRHAEAAKVPVVVALNKIDLGDDNKLKIYGQLAEHGLTPSGEWGGDVDIIPTSATTGTGVHELVEHLADLSSILELKADASLPARGTVIEAETKPGVGAVVWLLIQEGTLRVGDFVVCGNAFGKVRALLNDTGNRIAEAGPSIPVEVWGLDDVPTSGDRLFVVDSLQRAKEIASETKRSRIETARVQTRKVKSLEEMFQQRGTDEVPELNVVIKADVDGSVAALGKSLKDIKSDEVRLTIRHSAVGPVNDSDILLAATCDGIIVAFRVEVSGGARRLAEQHGVDVRPYRVIYDVCDDIRKALSGLLAPEERIEARATAEVRQVFRLTKVGAVGGSYVTQGVVDRNHFAKVVRDGLVVREGCKFASLKHFKDDVKEVRAGLECGIRLEGFDDIHAGDVIETYEIIRVARSL